MAKIDTFEIEERRKKSLCPIYIDFALSSLCFFFVLLKREIKWKTDHGHFSKLCYICIASDYTVKNSIWNHQSLSLALMQCVNVNVCVNFMFQNFHWNAESKVVRDSVSFLFNFILFCFFLVIAKMYSVSMWACSFQTIAEKERKGQAHRLRYL